MKAAPATVRFDFTVQCIQDNSAPEPYEWSVQQTIFLTSHFNTQPVRVTLKQDAPPTPISLIGTLPAAARNQIPATAAIGIACTAFHNSASDIPCRVECGTSHVLLSEFVNIGGRQRFSKDVHIQAHTVADKYEKAILRITMRNANIDSSLQLAPMSINANVSGTQLQQLLQKTYNMEMAMGNTIAGTQNIRCFLDISEAGIQLTGTYVPALAYIHGQVPVSNELFWTNALQNVLEREDRNVNWFMTCKDKNEQARIAFLMLDYPVTILPYISDEIERRTRRPTSGIGNAFRGKQGKEQFSNLYALLAGDCEDKARGGNITRRALKKFITESDAAAPKTLPLKALHHIDSILDQYVILMSLCVVHGAKAGDSASMPVGAHMANIGMPVTYFKQCMERSTEGTQLASRLPWPKKMEDGYETQILEGTGMFDPRGYRDPKAHVRQYIRQGKTVRKLAHPMIMEHAKDNPFFLGALQGWTTYFTDRGASKGMGGFWFAHATDGTRGSLYTDVTGERQCVAIRPMPEAPVAVQRLMIEANTFDMPPRPLVLSRIEDDMGNHMLDKLCDSVKRLDRSAPVEAKQQCEVMVHLMSHQLNKKVTDGLYTDIRDSLKRVYSVNYKREAVTDDFHGYRLVTSVKTDN